MLYQNQFHKYANVLIREDNIEEAKKLNEFNNNIYRLLFVESNPIPVKWMLIKWE